MMGERLEYLLRLGDSALVLAQRCAAWVAHAPIMEEDVALANVALDLFGQAKLWLEYAGEIEGAGRDADALAFHRDASDYRNLLLVEQPNGNFADTIVRGYFCDAWAQLNLSALAASSDERIAAIAAKSLKETAYHLRRSQDWLVRLGDGTDVSHERAQRAVDELWCYTGELFIGDEIDAAMVAQGVGVEPNSLRAPWLARVEAALETATLVKPGDGWMQRGGKQGRHTEALSYMLAEMQVLPRSYPGAQW
ncbi:MAG TPA: 1,2-phenylacetyl-CoA epoxidase subunit PaaC [Verrucomicrobiae bacterium]|nr:1,2-phenylacetyl-CoA epoxidase subunit PaaC [Verrucomicrobiae bacterium]